MARAFQAIDDGARRREADGGVCEGRLPVDREHDLVQGPHPEDLAADVRRRGARQRVRARHAPDRQRNGIPGPPEGRAVEREDAGLRLGAPREVQPDPLRRVAPEDAGEVGARAE